jgi:signal transduction histidine kinase
MDYFEIAQQLVSSIKESLAKKGYDLSFEAVTEVTQMVQQEVIDQYVDRVITQAESILEISPSQTEQEILQALAGNVVQFLGAEAASLRIYDPNRMEMVSFGSYPAAEEDQEPGIPFEDSIAGEVVKTYRSYFVPNILKEDKYKNKDKVHKRGIHSMLAIPISIPRFSLKDVDTEGCLQIYFKEQDKVFTRMEVRIAEMLSRRVSYVIARKRITGLQTLNVAKDKITEQIFLKIGKREGVKMRELFNLIVPELAVIVRIQRCSLFSVGEDRQYVILEAGYPEGQHGLGKTFSIEEPYVGALVNQTGPFGDFEHESIYPTYILIHNPKESRLLTPDLKRFLDLQQIHSVLYVPLRVKDVVTYFIAFDAQAYYPRFSQEEIEILTFFGMELMKGLRLEKMDDILHDFKNPAIAVAGFAKRLQKILQDGNYLAEKRKVDQALEVILRETSRIQELALTLHAEGREETVDLTEKLKRRFLINEEATKEVRGERIRLVGEDLESPLWVRCFPLHVERVLDNLLNNASNAVPEEGGELRIRTYRQETWAIAEIANTGQISEEDKDRYLIGDGRGRGIHITNRLVKRMGGRIEVESGHGQTIFRVMLPLFQAA